MFAAYMYIVLQAFPIAYNSHTALVELLWIAETTICTEQVSRDIPRLQKARCSAAVLAPNDSTGKRIYQFTVPSMSAARRFSHPLEIVSQSWVVSGWGPKHKAINTRIVYWDSARVLLSHCARILLIEGYIALRLVYFDISMRALIYICICCVALCV